MSELRSGIDLIEVKRLALAYSTFGERFLNRIYDHSEIKQFHAKSERAKPYYLAKNFAAKEAVSKVLGTGFSKGIRPKDIVIQRRYGGPKVELKGKAAKHAKEIGLEHISLSLTDTKSNAAAVATGIFN